MLLLQLVLIFTLPYISTLESVLGLVSLEKLLHTGLGCELIAHPCRECCRYSEDLCAQGHYCGASQGVNLRCCGTGSPHTLWVHVGSACPPWVQLGSTHPVPICTYGTYASQTRKVKEYLLICIIPYPCSWYSLVYLFLQVACKNIRKWYYSLLQKGNWGEKTHEMHKYFRWWDSKSLAVGHMKVEGR